MLSLYPLDNVLNEVVVLCAGPTGPQDREAEVKAEQCVRRARRQDLMEKPSGLKVRRSPLGPAHLEQRPEDWNDVHQRICLLCGTYKGFC